MQDLIKYKGSRQEQIQRQKLDKIREWLKAKILKSGLREGLYHAATNIRSAKAKVLPVADKIAKAAKTTAALGYGAYSAISGEGMAGLYAGVGMAEKASGVNSPKVFDKKAMVKTELDSAYKRKAKRTAGNTNGGTSSTP